MRARIVTDLPPPLWQVAHHGGQDGSSLVIGQALGHPMAHRSHQGVGGAEVDAYGNAPVVRVGRPTGFGNLKKGHECGLGLGFLCASSAEGTG